MSKITQFNELYKDPIIQKLPSLMSLFSEAFAYNPFQPNQTQKSEIKHKIEHRNQNQTQTSN